MKPVWGTSVRKSLGTVTLVMFLGLVIGAILSQVIGLFITDEASVAHQLFVKNVKFGLDHATWNLVVLDITFGIRFHFNFMSVVGVFVASQLLRWYR
jgi:hypothetical protein